MAMDPATMSPEELVEFMNGPATMPPPGEIPDFTRIDNRDGLATFVLTFNILIPTLFSLFYFYSRFVMSREFAHSDIYAIIAVALHIAFMSVTIHVLRNWSFHVHQWDYRVKELSPFMADFFVTVVLYILSAMFCKVAILLQWIRIFIPVGTRADAHKKMMYWSSIFLLWFNVLYHLAGVLLFIIPCAPFHKNEQNGDEIFSCTPDIKFDLIESCMNVLLDVLILIVPQRVIWSLEMPKQQKIGISIIFSVGIGAIAIAIARVAVTVKWYRARGIFGPQEPTQDGTYTMSEMQYICMAETSLHILIYMLPATPKAMKGLGIDKVFSTLGSVLSTTIRPFLSRGSRSGSDHTTRRQTFKRPGSSSDADESGLVGLAPYPSGSMRKGSSNAETIHNPYGGSMRKASTAETLNNPYGSAARSQSSNSSMAKPHMNA